MRYAWRLSFGEGLFLVVTPRGGRNWQYRYRYGGKQKKLALGTYPWLSLERAMMLHRLAREFLAAGTDPALRRTELRCRPAVAGLAA